MSELALGGYPKDTPVAVVYKATWPDERLFRGTIETIAEMVKKEAITKTALIIVGQCLGEAFHLSKLYDKDFSHEYRHSV